VIFALAVEGHGVGDITESIEQLLEEIPRAAGLQAQLQARGSPTTEVA
jgi:hypothetical protein